MTVMDMELSTKWSLSQKSLLGPGRCPNPKLDYKIPATEVVQLLQRWEEAFITTHWCLVKRTTRVTRCGHDSITYGQHITNWRQTIDIMKEEYWRTMKKGTITILIRTLKLDPHQHLSTTIVIQGGLDGDMNSQYRHFVSGSKHGKNGHMSNPPWKLTC